MILSISEHSVYFAPALQLRLKSKTTISDHTIACTPTRNIKIFLRIQLKNENIGQAIKPSKSLTGNAIPGDGSTMKIKMLTPIMKNNMLIDVYNASF